MQLHYKLLIAEISIYTQSNIFCCVNFVVIKIKIFKIYLELW